MFPSNPSNSTTHGRNPLWGGALCLALVLSGSLAAQAPPPKDYLVKVVCESADKIATIRFGPKGARIEKTSDTRQISSDISGPHGIVFSPGREHYYVSIGHGRPYGSVWKYASQSDALVGRVGLGFFPATEDVTPNGNFLFVVNFNLHGDPVPSSVSVVDTNLMMEVRRIPTCVMPHGSRVTRDGTRQYSACMMDDLLVEIDAEHLNVARSFRVTSGTERGFADLPASEGAARAGHAMDHGNAAPRPGDASCQPTWAQPSVDGERVYVACNKSSEIVEIDAEKWSLVRRIPAGPGVYNLAVTPDGKQLIATNKRGQSVSIFDLATGKELARLQTKRKVVHGAVVTPDGRYAFVSVEGVGEEPGTIEVIDLAALKTVATVDTPPQAAGIDFWKMDPVQ